MFVESLVVTLFVSSISDNRRPLFYNDLIRYVKYLD